MLRNEYDAHKALKQHRQVVSISTDKAASYAKHYLAARKLGVSSGIAAWYARLVS